MSSPPGSVGEASCLYAVPLSPFVRSIVRSIVRSSG